MTSLRQDVEPVAPPSSERSHSDHHLPEVRIPRESHHDTQRRRAELARTIEGEIIPRLMLAHRMASTDGLRLTDLDQSGLGAVGAVEDFARLVMQKDTSIALGHVESLLRLGVSLEAVFLDLLAPTARHLGQMWEDDTCDFTDVTIGLGVLQNLLREFSPAFRNEAEGQTGQMRVLLATVPGEQHTFGLFMVEEFFRREGWHVTSDPAFTEAEIIRLVRTEWFDLVGFSLSCGDLLEPLASVIRSVRRASRNPATRILVGGNLLLEQPEVVGIVGADGTATDGWNAVQEAVGRVSGQRSS